MASWPGEIVYDNAGNVVTDNIGATVYNSDSSLPGPLRNSVQITAGTTTKTRETETGRIEMRRFGSSMPDMAEISIQVDDDQVGTFEYFFQRTCNRGLNWFDAEWLSDFGYDDHRARILGKPKRNFTDKNVNLYTFTILIRPASECPADIFWPTGKEGV
jgi:hypothetical protein